MRRSPGRLICRVLGHKWAYMVHHASACRLCLRCGEAGWHRS